ncbi:MAG: hypothetical protein GF398_21925 [Chitinivibrionales bacterium]|nr:hypothetical protein [Chitinivibrionales bacterium]
MPAKEDYVDDVKSPFMVAVTSKANIVMIIIGLIFLGDYIAGSVIMLKFVNFMISMQSQDPATSAAKILTPFGEFSDRTKVARIYDYIAFGVPLGIALLSIVWNGIFTALAHKKID